ncbi:multidrug resistance-associated protein 4-like isoform X2 [Cynoglossus semilaevis]|uniref:Multidrug resistance-associated protein 4 n=1 Tax=Cynoglossus semilaevis TaxID=244447 RepID=A0A3P8W2X6_CYNSE|nr:multidrug resistance-associated protein 4-like isoform X2 [Cynoglossus semilaevis]XP_024918160.1 multidrug resistance-associated protein 4-like isoform X2 [Cynoglossus semilaevis]
METVTKNAKTNPAATAGYLSKFFFWWLNPFFRIANQHTLEEQDMYEVLVEDKSEVLGQAMQRCWDYELHLAKKEMKTPSLRRVIAKSIWKANTLLVFVAIFEEMLKTIQPIFLGKIVEYFENYDPNDKEAYHEVLGYGAVLSLCSVIVGVVHHQYFFHLQRQGWRLRVAMCHLIYKKALRLSNSAMMKTTVGQIVNLLSNDVNRFDEVSVFVHSLYIAPIQLVVVLTLLWFRIGPSCLAGLAVILILIPMQSMFGKLFAKFRSSAAFLTDIRMRTMNEVVSGIRIIKMYAWEKPFAAMVSDIRRQEISSILQTAFLQGINLALFHSTSKLLYFFTFTTYVLLGNIITASAVFVTTSLYSCIRLSLTLFFPLAVANIFESLVSIDRIQEFLMLDEVKKHCEALPPTEKTDACVEVQDLICFWDQTVDTPSLQDVSFSLSSNKLLAVIGPVGAGKSSLLCAILGELPVEKGTLRVTGKLTYASQQPWVFSGTIRSNILFGRELDPEKYERVLKACALKRDLELLPDGDLTLVGDRGVTLSGGQKARVNLARAVYEDADLYLLDDPLSAVDAEVGRHIFEQCICGLLKEKACVLVTHQLHYLNAADEILVLNEGYMVTKGTYTELQKSGLDFTSLLKKEVDEERQQPPTGGLQRSPSKKSSRSQSFSTQCLKDDDQLPVKNVPRLAEESRAQGTVPASLYVKYLTAGTGVIWITVVLVMGVCVEVTFLLQDWWLAYWSDQQAKLMINSTVIENSQNMTAQLDRDFYLGIYAGLTAATVFFSFARSLLLFYLLIMSAKILHNQMFDTVLRAPVRFFDTNPVGRILNRFSKDIGVLDSNLAFTFSDFKQLSLNVFGIVLLTASMNPWLFIPVVILTAVFFLLRRYYIQTSRDVKRLEGTTRSPVFSHVSSSLNGLWTIRAFGAEEKFQNMFDICQDLHSEAWFLFLTTSRWFSQRLDILSALFVLFVTFGLLLLRSQVGAGSVGLALTYCISLVSVFQWVVRQSAELESMMTSLERVVAFTELDNEAPWETEKRPPPDWPRKGMITFDQVNFAYGSDGPLVLKDLNVMFRPNEKVGIVGRTGAGKSSLTSALFRLSEPEGNIYIDGVLISDIGLHDLRQKITIIPQDPMLFSGSMRKNLDPFDQHTDEELWDVLEEVQLKPVVEELHGKMDTVLSESGSNFSVGQRQLVCLARALLRKNRILIIDEATANVDLRTDELIQKTIRDKFKDCTVLTIAHRLNTIIDSDRILVLDAGRIQACDAPHVLLQDSEGLFYHMVQQTGKQEAAALLLTAERAYENRTNLQYGHTDNLVISETPL